MRTTRIDHPNCQSWDSGIEIQEEWMPTIKKQDNRGAMRQRTAKGASHGMKQQGSKYTNQSCWKTTNYSRASCFIRPWMTSRPHHLKKILKLIFIKTLDVLISYCGVLTSIVLWAFKSPVNNNWEVMRYLRRLNPHIMKVLRVTAPNVIKARFSKAVYFKRSSFILSCTFCYVVFL